MNNYTDKPFTKQGVIRKTKAQLWRNAAKVVATLITLIICITIVFCAIYILEARPVMIDDILVPTEIKLNYELDEEVVKSADEYPFLNFIGVRYGEIVTIVAGPYGRIIDDYVLFNDNKIVIDNLSSVTGLDDGYLDNEYIVKDAKGNLSLLEAKDIAGIRETIE